MRKSKIAFVMLFISIAVAAYLSMIAKVSGKLGFDGPIASSIKTIFPEQTHEFFKMIEVLGAKPGIGVVGIAVILWLWFKKRNYFGMVTVLIAVALGNELSKLIKDIIKRPRPELEHLTDVESYGFPSGHAMVGGILYIVIAYFFFKEMKNRATKWLVGCLFFIIMGLVGASRIVLQVHYPSDVMAGYAFGYVWVYLVIIGYEYIDGRKTNLSV
ncbi:phosphatase PAP2 family protein [Bacillus marasmi]|uniref:phosphatase PAP2 family protein n=1 Tax=Bacillus marasmi TaxID=1926279 RepID=UPI0011CC3AE8|nr:phosphatase PAP2 family protein [Bacillus marasmi]